MRAFTTAETSAKVGGINITHGITLGSEILGWTTIWRRGVVTRGGSHRAVGISGVLFDVCHVVAVDHLDAGVPHLTCQPEQIDASLLDEQRCKCVTSLLRRPKPNLRARDNFFP